jgi:Uncharacterized protein conserved in bacteria (DUF2188)
MTEAHYKVVEHDGGWAYVSQGVYSETYATHEQATRAAVRAAEEQRLVGPTEFIEYQDETGRWRTEVAPGDDRPVTDVEE